MYKYFTVLVFSICMLLSSGLKAQSDAESSPILKFNQAYSAITNLYVDDVNADKVIETAIKGMLKDLDPHSVYISADEVKMANEPLEGKFEGIGIQFQILKDTILVISPISGGPSEKLGIQAGDKIVLIDGEDATGEKVSNKWVADHLRGDKGTKVHVSILRRGEKELLEYDIVRDKIPIYSVDGAFMLNANTGYIKVNRFAATTVDEFRKGLIELKVDGMENLVLDLRGNSGGYLKAAIDLADEFLGRGELIVYTEGKSSPKQVFDATARGGFEKGRLVVLIDEGSASASEIVSGAVQDWDRGIIIGRRSFGKGLVQKPVPLSDGSVIRLTTAKYYTPSGRSIQKPYDGGTEKYYKEIQDRYSKGEVYHADSIQFPDSLRFRTAHERLVYGGGGIMPDIYIEFDTSSYSPYYRKLIRKGVFNSYTLQYVNDHRPELMQLYPDFNSFESSFKIDKAIQKQFIQAGEDEGISYDKDGFETSEDHIQRVLRALMARNLYESECYYQVMVKGDIVIDAALGVIADPEGFNKHLVLSE